MWNNLTRLTVWLAAIALPLSAGTIVGNVGFTVFEDPTAWVAAHPNSTLIDLLNGPPALAYQGDSIELISFGTSSALLENPTHGVDLQLQPIASNVYSLAFYFTSLPTGSYEHIVVYGNAGNDLDYYSDTGSFFFGVTSSDPIANIAFATPYGSPQNAQLIRLDTIQQDGTEAPEPSTAVLLTTAAALLLSRCRPKHRPALITVVACAISTVPARAGALVYSSLLTWQSSTPGNTAVLDFESTTAGYYTSYAYSPYSFAAASGAMWVLPGAAPGTGSGHYLGNDSSTTLNIMLGAGVYGVAFNLGSNSTNSATATITATDINGLQYISTGIATSGSVNPAIFWGLRADVQLTQIKITFSAVLPQIDNVRYASTALPPQPPPVPEPSTAVLLTAGAFLLAWRWLLRNPQNHRRQPEE